MFKFLIPLLFLSSVVLADENQTAPVPSPSPTITDASKCTDKPSELIVALKGTGWGDFMYLTDKTNIRVVKDILYNPNAHEVAVLTVTLDKPPTDASASMQTACLDFIGFRPLGDADGIKGFVNNENLRREQPRTEEN